MSQLQTINTGPGGDTVKQGFDKVVDNFNKLREHFLDTVAPTSPVTGQSYLDSAVPSRLKGFLRQNGAWAKRIMTHILEENLDFDRFQAVRMLHEKLSSAPAPGAAEEGRSIYNTTLDLLQLIRTADVLTLAGVILGTDYLAFPCDILLTPSTPGDTITVNELTFYRLDGASEELSIVPRLPVPLSWLGNQDLKLRLRCAIGNGAGETSGDDITLAGNLIVVGAGELYSKAETTLAAAAKDIGSGTAQYTRHDVDMIVDYDAAANPVNAADVIRFTIGSDLSQVNPLLIQSAHLLVPVDGFRSEQ